MYKAFLVYLSIDLGAEASVLTGKSVDVAMFGLIM